MWNIWNTLGKRTLLQLIDCSEGQLTINMGQGKEYEKARLHWKHHKFLLYLWAWTARSYLTFWHYCFPQSYENGAFIWFLRRLEEHREKVEICSGVIKSSNSVLKAEEHWFFFRLFPYQHLFPDAKRQRSSFDRSFNSNRK